MALKIKWLKYAFRHDFYSCVFCRRIAPLRRFIPSLSALECFDLAARHRSFTRAAEDLGLTQSGVSRQIGTLEQFLGVRLFQRIGSRLELTEIGAQYWREIGPLMAGLEKAALDVVRGQRLEEALILQTSPGFAACWLLPRLGGFLAAHPEVILEVIEAEGTCDFSTSPADLAIVRGTGAVSDVRSDRLCAETLTVVAAPKLIPPGAALDHLDFTRLPTLQNATRPSLWMTWLRLSGLPHSGAIRGVRLGHSGLLIPAACAGLGLAVVPRLYVEDDLRQGRLWEPFGPAVTSPESYWILHPQERAHHPHLTACVTWLKRDMKRPNAGIPPL